MKECFLIVLILISLMGCASQEQNKHTFLFLTRPLVSDFHSLVVKGAQHASDDKQINLKVSQPKIDYDFDYQIKEIKKATREKNINGVIVTPNHSSQLLEVLVELDKHRIK